MLIDVDKLTKDGLTVNRDFEYPSAALVEEDAALLKPVHVELTVSKIEDQVRIKGRVSTLIRFNCSRCLTPFEFPVDSRFDLVFLPEEFEEIKEGLEEEDVNTLYYRAPQIDLREVVLEQLNLTFPLRPLCAEDCPGICPVCGAVIRDGACSCAVPGGDLRLESLKSLMKDKK
ncbi:MAG: DUF177 domain-containing protein [Candidatus Aminicenantes bacterium]|nr:DUF177 domain-containing protein [Candidatus Aminicenantes bacterium]